MMAPGDIGVVLAAGWAPRVLVYGLYLAGALLLGAVVIAWVNRWRQRAGSERLTPEAQLAQFRSLYEEGAISAEELEQLRSTVLGMASRKKGDRSPAVPTDGVRPANGTPLQAGQEPGQGPQGPPPGAIQPG